MGFKASVGRILRPANKSAFVHSLRPDAAIFDIGCGNGSAARLKQAAPEIRYVGIDIGDYHQTEMAFASMDRYIVTTSEQFASTIRDIGESFDGVISSHNIEHCEDPDAVIDAMCSVLKPGGVLYLAFPTEASVDFPKREGTLNFYDDPTHRVVPSFAALAARLEANGMRLEKAIPRSRPLMYAIAGLLLEPWSAIRNRVDHYGAIWALWGFESIVWARKPRA